MKYRIEVLPQQDDGGKTVYQWSVYLGVELVGGGYCATESEAHSDASSFITDLP